MARVEIPVQTLSRAGVAALAQTDADSALGNVIKKNDGHIYIEIVSSDAGPQTVGFAIPGLVDGEVVDDKVVAVPAGATRYAGPWPRRTYNQADNSVNVNPSVSTTLKFRAFKLPTT
jgi:hypothetical protein